VSPRAGLLTGLLVAAFLLPPSPGLGLSRTERRAVLDDIERLEVKLLRADQDIRSATVRVRQMEADLAESEARLGAAEDRLSERKGRLELRLRVMYRLRHRGFLPLLFSADTPHEFLRVARYLWWIIRADEESLDGWRSELTKHRKIQGRINEARSSMLQRAGVVSMQRDEARSLRDERQDLVGNLQSSDRRYMKTLLVQRRDKKLDVSLDLRQEAPPEELPVEQPERTHRRFERSRGRLPMPTVGDVRKSGRGIDILAPEGRPIRSVAEGQVLKVLHISGFGLVCIIDHGGGWSTVYGHASGYSVRAGQSVHSGQEIGTVGQTGSLEGALLHFQIRKDQDPQSPIKWLQIPPGINVRRR
jgi:septal ring factor EnvC (AmiA/AmiB activator)